MIKVFVSYWLDRGENASHCTTDVVNRPQHEIQDLKYCYIVKYVLTIFIHNVYIFITSADFVILFEYSLI